MLDLWLSDFEWDDRMTSTGARALEPPWVRRGWMVLLT